MASGFQYFDSTMIGAPPLRYGAGYMAAFLDYWLVTQGGWAIEFTGTNLRAYRSATGNRFRLRLDDTPAAYSRLRAYRSMSGISSGLTSPFPTAAQAVLNTSGTRKAGDSTETSPHAYWGIRTDRYIAVFFDQTDALNSSMGTAYRGFFQFGDVPSLCESDSHNTSLIFTTLVDSAFYNTLSNLGGVGLGSNAPGAAPGTQTVGFSGTPNGAVVSPASWLHLPHPINTNGSTQAATVLSQRLSYSPLLLSSSDSSTSPTSTAPRAKLPNVHMLFGSGTLDTDANYPAKDLTQFTIGSRTFLPLLVDRRPTGPYFSDCYLLETTDTDGAL